MSCAASRQGITSSHILELSTGKLPTLKTVHPTSPPPPPIYRALSPSSSPNFSPLPFGGGSVYSVSLPLNRSVAPLTHPLQGLFSTPSSSPDDSSRTQRAHIYLDMRAALLPSSWSSGLHLLVSTNRGSLSRTKTTTTSLAVFLWVMASTLCNGTRAAQVSALGRRKDETGILQSRGSGGRKPPRQCCARF